MGLVYVARNDRIPALVKIGCTDRTIDIRMRELSANTGVPGQHTWAYWCEVVEHARLERLTHSALDEKRDTKSKEFFRVTAVRARLVIRTVASQHSMVILGERSKPELDREDRGAIQRRMADLRAELMVQLDRTTSNPFRRAQDRAAQARMMEITIEMDELEERLSRLPPG